MTTIEGRQLTNKIVMVRPNFFGYNLQTAVDNSFQHEPSEKESETRDKALEEFGQMTQKLGEVGLTVVILNSPLGEGGEETPDAVFPNNWFSTHPGKLVLYPMRAHNRRLERQPENLRRELLGMNVLYPETVDLTDDENDGLILEGTGSLVLDRVSRIAYGLESQRTNKAEFEKWCELMGYEPYFFHAVDFGGRPVYHTNVVMSVGEAFAVVCAESVAQADERERLIERLERSGKEVIVISMEQMYGMCGNILQTVNSGGEKLVVMSERARKNFLPRDMEVIERNGLVVPVKIDTIETVGGGSARCMMAEVF